MNILNRFYYDSLTEDQKKIYEQLYKGFKDHREIIPLSAYCGDSISEIHQKVIYDNPQLYFVKKIYISKFPVKLPEIILPQYRFSKEECLAIDTEIDKVITPLINSAKGKSEIEKELLIHDFLIKGTTYKDLKAPYSHEMPGSILYGIGVCEGISKAYKYISEKVGMDSMVVVGNVKDSDSLHAWNIVSIDGANYQLDVTYDLNLTNNADTIRYDYFDVSDDIMSDRKSIFKVPECATDYGFYKKGGLYAPSRSVLMDILRKNSERDSITFQMPQLRCDKDYIAESIFYALDHLDDRSRNARIIPNHDRDIYSINFK